MNHSAYLDSVFGLEGKTILVTGAAGGIGAAISKGLADAGGGSGPVRPDAVQVPGAGG